MNYRNQNFKIPIVADGLETSADDDYQDNDENDIMFASHSWKHNDNNNDNNNDNDNTNDSINDGTYDLSDGDVMSMEGY